MVVPPSVSSLHLDVFHVATVLPMDHYVSRLFAFSRPPRYFVVRIEQFLPSFFIHISHQLRTSLRQHVSQYSECFHWISSVDTPSGTFPSRYTSRACSLRVWIFIFFLHSWGSFSFAYYPKRHDTSVFFNTFPVAIWSYLIDQKIFSIVDPS